MKAAYCAMCLAVSVSASLASFAESELDEFVAGRGPVEYVSDMSVTNVRNYAFSENRSIARIDLPEVVDVGFCAFRGCSGLKSVSIPKLTDISKMAATFSGCIKLDNVYLNRIEFTEPKRMNGFPWQAPNRGIVFHFANGDYGPDGKRID